MMESFSGQIAVVTGGGTGMGRELVRQLVAEGCHVSMCDVTRDAMAESEALAREGAPSGTRVTSFVADVADEAAVFAFRYHVCAEHATDHVNLLFNNAGIARGGSFVADDRGEWERTYGICWGGVYNGCRAFLPLVIQASSGHIVNTSSVNGLWASVGPHRPHTAYSAAKFAVRGFTEALIADLRVHAPHVQAHVVFPGYVGTSIVLNSAAVVAADAGQMSVEERKHMRASPVLAGIDTQNMSDDEIHAFVRMHGEAFRDNAPLTAEQAARIILDGVGNGRWRILVGDDARAIDRAVRAEAESAYEVDFMEKMFHQRPAASPT